MLNENVFIDVTNNSDSKSRPLLDDKNNKSLIKMVKDYSHLEPLLLEQQRLNAFPIKHYDIYELYNRQTQSFWNINEIKMDQDRNDFLQIKNKNIQHFIKNILAFFATADGAVILNISTNFVNDIKNFEIQLCYNWQVAMEGIHSVMYSVLIDQIVQDKTEKDILLNAANTMLCIQEKNKWGIKWAYSGAPFIQRLVANAIVEGIFFSGSFCAIFWIKEMNIMPGLCQSNELISRDENMHCEMAYLVYNKLLYKMSDDEIKEMVSDAIEIEKRFINDSLRCDLIGMNPKLMAQYIEYVADVLLINLGHGKLYNSLNPFTFMKDAFNLQIKNNFFERKSTSYQRAKVTSTVTSITDDF